MTTSTPPPPGVRVLRDFLSEKDEAALLAALLDDPASPPGWTRLASGRRVAHFNTRFDYSTRGAGQPAPPLPDVLAAAVASAATAADLEGFSGGGGAAPDPATLQVTANDYPPGAGIHWHVDSHGPFGPALAVLSLGSGATLELRQAGGGGEGCFRRCAVWLPPRSLLVLGGEARHGWEHCIAPRKTDPGAGDGAPPVPRARRVSLTIRTLRGPGDGPCACSWPALCEDQGGGAGRTRDAAIAAARAASDAATANLADLSAAEEAGRIGLDALAAAAAASTPASPAADAAAAAVEAALVRSVYDRIAPHFSDTRVALWPQVVDFVRSKGPQALVLDVGAGNGKYLKLAAPAGGAAVLASEPCPALAAAAAASGPAGRRGAVIIGDGLHPTWRPGIADGVICVAVVHHLVSAHRRSRLIARCARACAPGGSALITAWARPDAQPDGKESARAQRWRPVPGGGPGDFLVPWHEPPGWDTARPTTAAWPPSSSDGGAGAASARPHTPVPVRPLPLPAKHRPIRGAGPGGALTPEQRRAQSAVDRARQPPPAAWRFYHCYTGEELGREAAAGAALATAEARKAGEAGAAYEARDAFLDRGNWCVEVVRLQ